MRLQRTEGGFEMSLFALALWMAEARQQHLAIEHDRAIGGEHEIRQTAYRRYEFDRGAERDQLAMQRLPLPRGGGVGALVARPTRRIHPRIDGIADRKMVRPAHQEPRLWLSEFHLLLPSQSPIHAAARFGRVPPSSWSTSAKRSSAQSRSSRAITRGGARRTTV